MCNVEGSLGRAFKCPPFVFGAPGRAHSLGGESPPRFHKAILSFHQGNLKSLT